MATIAELLEYGKEQLEQCNNEYAKYERKVLLEEVLGISYMQMLMCAEEEVAFEKENLYKTYIKRRCEHYPLQYLLGIAYFMDYSFYVDENVLIPRNDTEILVETTNTVLAMLPDSEIRLLDLCCGSGCIGASLKLYNSKCQVVFSDYSEDALIVTKKNLEKYHLEAEVLQGDLFDSVTGKFQVIVSNPPYIEKETIKTLMPEVREYEPMMALDGGEDGLDFYRRIIKEAPSHLEKEGYLFLEIGYNQADQVVALMKENTFLDIQVKKDYAGLDRVVYGHL